MGYFKDYLDILKSTLTGLIPLGGTLNPVSEGVPMALAQNIKGGTAVYNVLETLADIPYSLLVLDMEAIVRYHIRPDSSVHERTVYRLIQMPPPDTKVIDIPGYVITDFWQALPGPGVGPPGAPGTNGWSPVYSLEDDGPTRVVEKFFQWWGGSGVAPAAPVPPNDYRGSSGWVSKSLAINVKGPAGAPGSDAQVRPMYYVSKGVKEISPPLTSDVFVGAPYGQFRLVSGYLDVINNWSAERYFMVQGEVPVSNDNLDDSLCVRLFENTPSHTGGLGSVDENFSRVNFVTNSYHKSVHKIKVSKVVLIQPGATRAFSLEMCLVEGTNALYRQGFLEAYGL